MTLDCLSLHSTTTKTLFSFWAISYLILLLSPRTNIFPSFLFLNMYNTPLLIFCSSFPPFQSSYLILRSVLPAHYRISHASRYLIGPSGPAGFVGQSSWSQGPAVDPDPAISKTDRFTESLSLFLMNFMLACAKRA